MNSNFHFFRPLPFVAAVILICGLAACTKDEVRSPASGPGVATSGPGVENPAAAGGGNVIPALGGAGNGGGVSGGGAGVGSAGQGAR